MKATTNEAARAALPEEYTPAEIEFIRASATIFNGERFEGMGDHYASCFDDSHDALSGDPTADLLGFVSRSLQVVASSLENKSKPGAALAEIDMLGRLDAMARLALGMHEGQVAEFVRALRATKAAAAKTSSKAETPA